MTPAAASVATPASTPLAAGPTATPDGSSPPPIPTGTPVASPAAARFDVIRSPIRLPAARSRAVALVLGSVILLCGGLTSAGTTTGSILSIDPRSGQVSGAGTLAPPVHDAAGGVLGGSGFIFGGGRLVAGAVVQRIGSTGGATLVGHLPAVRADLAAVSVDGEIVVVGGGTPASPDDRVLATTDGRHFRTVATLLVGVRYPAVAVAGGMVYVIGGSTPSADADVIQAIDPLTGDVRIVGHLAHRLSHASAFVLGGTLLIAGGRVAGRAQNELWQLDVASGIVTRAGRLPYPVSDATTAVIDGTGYLIGGEGLGSLASIITIAAR